MAEITVLWFRFVEWNQPVRSIGLSCARYSKVRWIFFSEIAEEWYGLTRRIMRIGKKWRRKAGRVIVAVNSFEEKEFRGLQGIGAIVFVGDSSTRSCCLL